MSKPRVRKTGGFPDFCLSPDVEATAGRRKMHRLRGKEMPEIKNSGFSTVETNLEELDEKIHAHRRKIFRRVVEIIMVLIIAAALFGLWMALRSYDSYEVISTQQRDDSEAVKFEEFSGKIIKYSNDGASCMDNSNKLIWNQSYEMTRPKLDMCQEYLAIYDQQGTSIYIMDQTGMKKEIDTNMPIQTVNIAGQGTIAVLMKSDNISYVKLYDRNGKELASGEFYGDQGGFPVDIALSDDAQKMAVDMVDVNDGNIKSTISFYNFGSVGQNEIDNNVGTFSYSDMLIPDIEYISDNRMYAIGDNEIIVFGGSQKPAVEQEISLDKEVESVFYNDKYIGIVTANEGEEISHHIQVYDKNGKVIMENDTSLAYTAVEFLQNNDICIRNDHECELFTIHSIKKFAYTFDNKIYRIMSGVTSRRYTFIMDGETQEVRLK